jgi:hypothetical protein
VRETMKSGNVYFASDNTWSRGFFRECSRGFLQLMRVCDSLTLSKNALFSQSGLYGGSPMRRTRSAKRGSDRNGSQSGSTLR